MSPFQKTFLLLAIAAADSGIAMRVVEPMLPRLAEQFETSVPATAAIITAFALAQAGAQYFHGPFGDRYGTLRVVTILMAMSAVGSFGCAMADSLDSLIFWRFATGAFSSGSMTLGMVYLAEQVPARRMLARIGRRGCVTVGGLVGGILFIVIALTPYWPVVMVCTMALGFSFYMVHNTLQTKATEMAPQARASGMALFSMCWAGGQAVGAAAMGAAVATFGYTPMLILFGCGFAALALSVRIRFASH